MIHDQGVCLSFFVPQLPIFLQMGLPLTPDPVCPSHVRIYGRELFVFLFNLPRNFTFLPSLVQTGNLTIRNFKLSTVSKLKSGFCYIFCVPSALLVNAVPIPFTFTSLVIHPEGMRKRMKAPNPGTTFASTTHLNTLLKSLIMHFSPPFPYLSNTSECVVVRVRQHLFMSLKSIAKWLHLFVQRARSRGIGRIIECVDASHTVCERLSFLPSRVKTHTIQTHWGLWVMMKSGGVKIEFSFECSPFTRGKDDWRIRHFFFVTHLVGGKQWCICSWQNTDLSGRKNDCCRSKKMIGRQNGIHLNRHSSFFPFCSHKWAWFRLQFQGDKGKGKYTWLPLSCWTLWR